MGPSRRRGVGAHRRLLSARSWGRRGVHGSQSTLVSFFFLLLCTLINFHPARRNCVLYDLNKIFEKTFQCFILFKKNVLANIQSSAFCAGIIT
jgi:hypothetical protein